MIGDPTLPDLLANTTAARSITPELLLQELRSDVSLTMIDVRDRESVARATIEGARSFPLRNLQARLPELVCWRSRPLIVLSRTGSRARTAATLLCLAGFDDVFFLDGGIEGWIALGYPVGPPKSAPPPPLHPASPPGRL